MLSDGLCNERLHLFSLGEMFHQLDLPGRFVLRVKQNPVRSFCMRVDAVVNACLADRPRVTAMRITKLWVLECIANIFVVFSTFGNSA